jgi:hypothetical protein
MDIGGINRIKPLIKGLFSVDVQRKDSATDRDAQGQAAYSQPKPTKLTPEQEDEALAKLNAMPAFANSGLRAEIVRAPDVVTHIVVLDANGAIVRKLPYEQIVDTYLMRNAVDSRGRLINRSA